MKVANCDFTKGGKVTYKNGVLTVVNVVMPEGAVIEV